MERHKLIIIGSGPAGLTAAIYASRGELEPLVLAGSIYGGQLMLTTGVGNFPGFINDIQGPELINNMIEQAKRYGATILYDDVKRVDFSDRPLKIFTEKKEYLSDAVIMATGASAKWLGLESELRFRGKGIHSCATCDGFFYKDKKIAVVGGGDAAMEDATFLTKFASEVMILVRSDKLRASKIMQRRAEQNPKIKFIYNTEVVEVLGGAQVEGLRVRNNQTKEETVLSVDGAFVAIGHTPNTEFLQNSGIELDHKGYIRTTDHTRTNIDGVFVAGDVNDFRYRQAVTAAGEGCKAAMDAEKWLAGQQS